MYYLIIIKEIIEGIEVYKNIYFENLEEFNQYAQENEYVYLFTCDENDKCQEYIM